MDSYSCMVVTTLSSPTNTSTYGLQPFLENKLITYSNFSHVSSILISHVFSMTQFVEFMVSEDHSLPLQSQIKIMDK